MAATLQLKYPAISSFFSGVPIHNQTLGNRFLTAVITDISTLKKSSLIFPQRVPKSDFFSEIARLEGVEFVQTRDAFLTSLTDGLLASADPHDPALCTNLKAFFLRIGVTIPRQLLRNEISDHYNQIVADFSADRIDATFAVSRLLRLYEQADSTVLKASIANRIVVMSARGNLRQELEHLDAYLRAAEQELITMSDPTSLVLASMIQRGRPMLPSYSPKQKLELILNSIVTIGQIEAPNQASAIALKELRLTTELTLAKTFEMNGYQEQAGGCFDRMIRLDPFDSVVQSEYGLFCFRNSKLHQALEFFKAASELGPPGVSMNRYFEGQCLLKLDLPEDAANAFLQSAKADSLAVSPLIELLKLKKNHGIDGDIPSILDLLKSDALWEQLDETERSFVSEIAKAY